MMYSAEDQLRYFDQAKLFLQKTIAREEIEQLRDVIRFFEWKYYVQNESMIPDSEYDALFTKLRDLENQFPGLITEDSPTQRVSSDLSSAFNTVSHLGPMLSLDNSYNEEDLFEFDRQIKKLTGLEGDLEYSVEPKFDGGSITLVYEQNILVRSATRGDGAVGEEITNNVKTGIPSIPLKAAFSDHGIFRAELRGEAIIAKSKFEELNAKRDEEGEVLFANPRNAATGALRMKDPNEVRQRKLEAFIYQIGVVEDEEGNSVASKIGTQSAGIEILQKLGFKTPEMDARLCSNIREVVDYCREMESRREQYPYEIDGMVVKLNQFRLQELCGYTQHHPRWAIAYKFKAKKAVTRLMEIQYQVGKIGTITPVAKVKPVQLAGVTVSSISLHNEDFILSKDIRIGDVIEIERAGDVIPHVVGPVRDLRNGEEVPFVFPEYCPVNDSEQPVRLVKESDEAAWRCPDCVCGAQNLQKIIFHVSKPAMDIDGFGRSYVEQFYRLGWIRDIADVYDLDFEKIAQLEGFGAKSAGNLKEAVEQAKNKPIHRLLHSLSIHHLGKKASKLVAERVRNIWELKDWTLDDYTAIRDIGPVVGQNMVNFFSRENNLALLKKLEQNGVNFNQLEEDQPVAVSADAPLAGKTILFTGTLTRLNRKEAQLLAEKAGAKNISAVSSNLHILVVGENAGSKLSKAQKLGTVEILTEDAFLDLVS